MDNIISFLLGNSIKMVDDHYDINMYDKDFIKIVKFIGFILLSYWNNLGFEYNLFFFLEVIICYFVNQIDNDFYKNMSLYIIIIFISYCLFYKKKYFVHEFNIPNIIFYFISAFILIFIESKLFKEDISKLKFFCRFGILFIGFSYFILLNLKNDIIKQSEFSKNIVMVFNGYFFISVTNIYKKIN